MPPRYQVLNGGVTSATDEMVLVKALALLRAITKHDLLSKCRALGNAIFAHLQPSVERIQRGRIWGCSGHQGQHILPQPYLHGIAMWATTLEFQGEATASILYHRLLPFINLRPEQVVKQLVLTGKVVSVPDIPGQ